MSSQSGSNAKVSLLRAALCRESKKALFCFVLLRSEGAFLASEALEKREKNLKHHWEELHYPGKFNATG